MKFIGVVSMILVFLMCLTVIPFGESSDADSNDGLLIDYGNGDYNWSSIEVSGTYMDVLIGCKGDSVSGNQNDILIDGMGRMLISGTLDILVDWKIYEWDNDSWKYQGSDFSGRYEGGFIAFCLFSDDGLMPASTPDEKTAWTQLGGSTSSFGTSDSYGPSDPSLPVEWYQTYTTGYVDSGLVVAGDLLYHTTGGTYGASGTDADPWIYCLNRYTGDIVWKYHGAYGAGYEVTTPLIVSGFLIVTTTNGNLYVFDRYTGDVLDDIEIPYDPPMDSKGDILWDGRTFVTGGTTPIYDSGAIFFGSADGKVYCYDISATGCLTEVWCYDPPATVDESGNYTGSKGCFYYYAPTIEDVGGTRMLFIGNYEGFVHAIDITSGKAVWVKQVIDLRDDNRCVPGTPGAVGSIIASADNSTILVSCSDGGLFTLYGYIVALNPLTGDILKDSEGNDWKAEGLFTTPVSTDDGFYTYVSPVSSNANGKFTSTTGSKIDITSAVYKFDWDGKVVWKSSDYQMIKAPLTLADGILYAMDYSAGSFWPTGGAVTAIDSDDGSELWRVLLSPYTSDSYSMVQPTVVEGRIYVANDLGAVYCLSDIAGPSVQEYTIEALQTQGFHHWSWFVIIIVVALAVIFLIKFY